MSQPDYAPASPRPPAWVVWLVAAPFVLFGLAWGALALLLPPARATALVRTQLARSLARDVRFDGVGLSLWPPVRLSVKHVELAEPGCQGRHLCEADIAQR